MEILKNDEVNPGSKFGTFVPPPRGGGGFGIIDVTVTFIVYVVISISILSAISDQTDMVCTKPYTFNQRCWCGLPEEITNASEDACPSLFSYICTRVGLTIIMSPLKLIKWIIIPFFSSHF